MDEQQEECVRRIKELVAKLREEGIDDHIIQKALTEANNDIHYTHYGDPWW